MWADVLGAALSTGSQLSRQRRLDTQDEEERRLKMQREKQLIDLALRDQQLQEESNSRDRLKEVIASVGPGGVIKDAPPELLANAQKFLPGRLQQQEGTLSSTKFLPGAGGEARMSPSPGLMAGTVVMPNRMEQIALDEAEQQRQTRQLKLDEDSQAARLRSYIEQNPDSLFAKGPVEAARLWAMSGLPGQPPQDPAEWDRRTAIDQKNRMAQIGAMSAGRGGGINSGTGSALSPEGLQVAAYQYLQTGTMPPLGMGASGARMSILNEAGRLAGTSGNPQLNAALYKADSAALTLLQRNMTGINAYKETARANIQVMLGEAAKMIDTGSPFLNLPLRKLAERTGDPNVASFEAARRTVVPEIARILTNPNLVGVLSDSSRHEIEEIISGSATIPQMIEVMRVLDTDMTNRSSSLENEYNAIVGRLQGRGPAGAPGMPGVVGQPDLTAPPGPTRPRFELLPGK